MKPSVEFEHVQQQQALLTLLDYLQQQDYQFTVITPLSHQRILARKYQQPLTQRTLQDIFGWNLPFTADDLPPELFKTLQQGHLLHLQQTHWISTVRVASLDQQLFIHSAFPTVEQDAVFFGPDTYRFAYHLKQYLNMHPHHLERVVELCCGTSAAAILVAKQFPEIGEIWATDINAKALFYSQINRYFSGLHHLQVQHSDLFQNLPGQFDLIFANPPYLMDLQQRQYRHGGDALDGTDLAFDILKQGLSRLTAQGSLFLYTGIAIHEQGNKFLMALQQLMHDHPHLQYSYDEIDPDVFGEELEQPGYEQIERIALAIISIRPL